MNNDIKSIVELVDFISEKEDRIQQIEDRQKEIYRESSSRKRSIKNEEQYREYQIWHVEVQEELDELKQEKRKIKRQIQLADDIIKENQEKAKKKREKKGTSAEEINKMATTSTRNVGTSSSKAKGRAIDAEKEEKIRKAQELAKNAKPGSLTSKANLVNKYNSGVKTEEVIPEKQDNKKKK